MASRTRRGATPVGPTATPAAEVDAHGQQAPNLRAQYPLLGARTGPAWREVWQVLGSGEWVNVRTLCVDVAPRHGLSPQALYAVVQTARSVPPNHPGRLETRMGDDRLLQVRRAHVPQPADPTLDPTPDVPPAAALNGMFAAPAPVVVTHDSGMIIGEV